MRHFAVVGSGPGGFYTAEALGKAFGDSGQVDLIDRYPVPYGLIRFGVAPDHQSLKAVSKRYDKVVETPGVSFLGNICVGSDVSVAELLDCYDAVILATGAPNDRKLGIPGEDLPGVFGSGAFVGWYNGHPQFADLKPPLDGSHAAVIGNGNVALDVARILAKTRQEFEGSDIVGHALEALDRSTVRTVAIVGRRGPHQIAMTPKELGELGRLEDAAPIVDPADFPPVAADDLLEPGQRKSVSLLRDFATRGAEGAKGKQLLFDFFARPVRIEGDGRAERLIVERTQLGGDGSASGTGETYAIPASLIVSCIGYSTAPIDGVPYDQRAGRFVNSEGRISERLYCVGWARRGPTGTIGTNRPDGYDVAAQIEASMPRGSGEGRTGGAALKALLQDRSVEVTDFDDWRAIEKAEEAAARQGSPREKFVRTDDWLALLRR